MYYILLITSTTFMVTAGLAAALRFRRLDLPARFLAVLVWGAFLSEVIAYISVRIIKNNSLTYTIYGIFEFVLVCLYFNSALHSLSRRKVGIVVGAIGALFGLTNLLFFQEEGTLNTGFILLGTVVITFMSLLFFYSYLYRPSDIRGSQPRLFAATSFLMFGSLLTFVHFSLYDFISQLYVNEGINLYLVMACLNALMYLGFTIVFLTYHKLHR